MVTFGQQATGTIMGPPGGVNTFNAQPKFFVLGAAAALPVSISAFTTTVNSGTVVLNWTGQQEVNSKANIIERSNEGNNNWKQMGTVQAAAQSAVAANYKFEDNTASAINDNRLGITDANGTITYSKTLIARLKNTGANVTLFPNPVVNTVNSSVDKISLVQQGFSINIINEKGQMNNPAQGCKRQQPGFF